MIISILSGSFTLYMYDHFTLYRHVRKTFTFKLILFELKNRALIVKKERKNEFVTRLRETVKLQFHSERK